jgi:hypothetical protein
MKEILSRLAGIIKRKPHLNHLRSNRGYEIIDRFSFRRLIEMERYRVHRNNMQFSLVLFNVDAHQGNHDLLYTIFQKIRRTDQIGWFDDCHIGILLPNTATSGAKTIANLITDEICKRQQVAKGSFSFKTLSYPNSLQVT